jgi:hypothetical protein
MRLRSTSVRLFNEYRAKALHPGRDISPRCPRRSARRNPGRARLGSKLQSEDRSLRACRPPSPRGRLVPFGKRHKEFGEAKGRYAARRETSAKWPAHTGTATVAQTSKSAVSWVSKPANYVIRNGSPTWKSAIQQVWKPALRAGATGRMVAVPRCALEWRGGK